MTNTCLPWPKRQEILEVVLPYLQQRRWFGSLKGKGLEGDQLAKAASSQAALAGGTENINGLAPGDNLVEAASGISYSDQPEKPAASWSPDLPPGTAAGRENPVSGLGEDQDETVKIVDYRETDQSEHFRILVLQRGETLFHLPLSLQPDREDLAGIVAWWDGHTWHPFDCTLAAERFSATQPSLQSDKARQFVPLERPAAKLVAAGDRAQAAELSQGTPSAANISIQTGENDITADPSALNSNDTRDGSLAAPQRFVLIDAPYDPLYVQHWLKECAEQNTLGLLPEAEGQSLLSDLLANVQSAKVLSGEQSNTSVLLKDGPCPAIIKFFRVLVKGQNPEVEVPLSLYQAGFTQVPKPLGYSTLSLWDLDGSPFMTYSAAASTLLSEAEDGFELLCQQAKSNKPVTKMIQALGRATQQLHLGLRQVFGDGTDPSTGAMLASRLKNQYHSAKAAYPQLSTWPGIEAGINAMCDTLRGLGALPATQRVHGDFHLGQTLYQNGQWYIIDFEGEPLRPLEQRIAPDQVERDIAGMLRSFDYVKASANQSGQWLNQVRLAFLDGYFAQQTPSAPQLLILKAYEVEKSLYEIAYEAQQRPDWVKIPLRALLVLLH